MEQYAMYFIDLVLHLDKHLPEIMAAYGHFIYAILFLVVFCETGLVVTPFLPGDSAGPDQHDFITHFTPLCWSKTEGTRGGTCRRGPSIGPSNQALG